jgi:hypothetical protein
LGISLPLPSNVSFELLEKQMKYIVEPDPFPEIEYYKANARTWFLEVKKEQALHQEIQGLKSEIVRLMGERDLWKDAWFKQRLATGKAWWEGYRKAFTYIRSSIPYSIPYLGTKK